MMTQRESITYSGLICHLLALREDVLRTSSDEAKVLDRIVSDLVSLEVFDHNTAGENIPAMSS